MIPHDPSALDGLYHRGAKPPAVLVASPHPDRGSMEHPQIAEIAWAVARAEHPVLRFNYPGVGASPGEFADRDAIEAFASAFRHLSLSEAAPDVACIGVGWGAWVAAAALDHVRPERLIMVQPVEETWSALKTFEGPVRAVFAEADDTDRRARAGAAVARCADGRVTVIAGADATFRVGLVHLGRIVVETLV